MPLPGCGVGYLPTLHPLWVPEGRAFFSRARSGPSHASLEAAAHAPDRRPAGCRSGTSSRRQQVHVNASARSVNNVTSREIRCLCGRQQVLRSIYGASASLLGAGAPSGSPGCAGAPVQSAGLSSGIRSSSAAKTALAPYLLLVSTKRGVEPTLGFEPRTCCLRNSCSTAELCRPGFHAQLQLITGDSTESG